MKALRSLLFLSLFHTVLAQDNPGWGITQQATPENISDFMEGFSERSNGGETRPSRRTEAPLEPLTEQEAAKSLSEAEDQPTRPLPSGMMLMSGPLGNEADTITPEIQSLAEGLRNDPLKIYEYVHNYIGYECYYGSKKGAHLTLLEGSGNDMDQAALLVALFRAAGYEATYTHGPAQFMFNEFVDWWGISPTPYSYMSNSAFAAMLGLSDTSTANVNRWKKRWAIVEAARSAGFFYVEPFTGSNGQEWLSIPYTWVNFHDGTTTRLLSPAFKFHVTAPGINLIAATQYNRANFLSAAGGSTGTPDYVSGLNETNITSQLATNTSNLLSEIRANHHDKYAEEIIGGRRIATESYTNWNQVLEMYPDPIADWASIDTWSEIPTAKMTKLEITAGTYNYDNRTFTGSPLYSEEITVPSLAGKKLSLSFSGNTARIYLDEILIGSTFNVTPASFDLQLKFKHGHHFLLRQSNGTYIQTDLNHTDRDQTTVYHKGNENAYAFSYTFGNPERHLRKRQDQLDA